MSRAGSCRLSSLAGAADDLGEVRRAAGVTSAQAGRSERLFRADARIVLRCPGLPYGLRSVPPPEEDTLHRLLFATTRWAVELGRTRFSPVGTHKV
jgi:hypothetical protein